jgi:hypothetical protein
MEKCYLLKLFQKWGEGAYRRMVDGENLIMIYLIYCKNIHKCQNVPPPSTTIKNKDKKIPTLHHPNY